MYAGRSVEDAPVDGLFDDPQHPYTIGLLGALPGRGPAIPTACARFPDPCRR